jgi:indole-3-glycerol phosphate synthase
VNVLERIVVSTRAELEVRKALVSPGQLRALAAAVAARDRRSFGRALQASGLSLIAEHKRRSPSAGAIREDSSLQEIVGAYERAGAAALSILTEGPNFGGSLDDLRAAREAVLLPLLRKDFIVDPYQVDEALIAGADAILLIVAALEGPALSALHAHATASGLDVLVEVHDEPELQRALELGAAIIGINNRDLTTLEVDTNLTFELRRSIPDGTMIVAESGFSEPAQLEALSAAGVDAVLIGEALMRSPDLESAVRALTASV